LAEWCEKVDIFTWKALTMVRWSLLEFRDRVFRLLSAIFSLPWNGNGQKEILKKIHTGNSITPDVFVVQEYSTIDQNDEEVD